MNKKDIFHFLFLFILWIFFFRKFFFQGMVPVPGNLLVSFFSPWKEEQWPQYPGGVYKQGLFGFDTIRQIYPWRSLSTDQLLNLQWPLWNPYQFSGAPHLANFQTAVFYPPNLLYLFLPQVYAWTILFMMQFLFAGLAMYLLARKFLISAIGSFISAFSYAFSLTTSVWAIYNTHGHQYIYLPLIFYFIEHYRQKKEDKTIFWLVILLILTFLAGRPESFIFILGFCGLYFIYRTEKIVPWLLIGFITLALTAFAWLPLVEYYQLSSREIKSSEFNYEKTLFPAVNLITLIAPDFFGNPTTANHFGKPDYTESAVYAGLVAFIFSLIALKQWKDRSRKFFILVLPFIFAFCLDWFLPRLLGWLKIPIITSTVATRVLFLATFSFCLLAGFGVDDFLKKKKFPKISLLPGIFFLCLFIFLLIVPKIFPGKEWFGYLRVMKRNLLLPMVIFLGSTTILFLSYKFNKTKKLVYLLIPLMMLDLFYVANKVIPFTYKELVFPSHPLIEFLQKNSGYYRFAGSEASNIDSNFATYYGLFSTEGYDTLYPRYYGELIWAGDSGNYKEDISRTTVVFPVNRSNTQHRLEDLLGVKFILEKDDNFKSDWDPNDNLFPPERYQLVWQRKNWKVYENKKVLPRAFLASDYLVMKDKKAVIEKIYAPEFNPARTVILEQNPPQRNLSAEEGKAEIIKYEPNKIEIETETKGNKLLFLSDTFYPGWHALIDGKETKIYKTNHAFRSIVVPQGRHKVIFAYQPLSFLLGLYVSGLFLIAGIIKSIIQGSRATEV